MITDICQNLGERRKGQKYIRGRGRDYQAMHIIGLPIRTHTSAFYMYICVCCVYIRISDSIWCKNMNKSNSNIYIFGYQSDSIYLHSTCIFVWPVFLGISNTSALSLGVFDMPNPYPYNIWSMSIFCKIPLSISILIFSRMAISISVSISIFFKLSLSILISISIFF